MSAACVLVAGKLEEFSGPALDDIVEWSGIETQELIAAESELCRIINMDLMFPSAVIFLDYFVSMLGESAKIKSTALGVIEVFTFSDDNSTHLSSCIATCALWIARDHHKAGEWTHLHVAFCGYTFNQLQDVLQAWNAIPLEHLPERCIEPFTAICPVAVWQP